MNQLGIVNLISDHLNAFYSQNCVNLLTKIVYYTYHLELLIIHQFDFFIYEKNNAKKHFNEQLLHTPVSLTY